jgi:hypothetical protein
MRRCALWKRQGRHFLFVCASSSSQTSVLGVVVDIVINTPRMSVFVLQLYAYRIFTQRWTRYTM